MRVQVNSFSHRRRKSRIFPSVEKYQIIRLIEEGEDAAEWDVLKLQEVVIGLQGSLYELHDDLRSRYHQILDRLRKRITIR